jgi:8-oxo-dGTP diphosphatase
VIRVVAAAIVRGDAVLTARRAPGRPDAGGWEFPGGKVEAGEDGATALARECREELGVEVAVGQHLATARDGRIELALHLAELVHGKPATGPDHDELRWLTVDALDDVAWLPIDAELLPRVRTTLTDV